MLVQRILVATAIMALSCAACVTAEKTLTKTQLLEAQNAFNEATRLQAVGQYTEAAPLAERALELREAVLGRTQPEVANCLNLLGIIHLRRGDYDRAKPLLHSALAIRVAVLGKYHLDVAKSLNSLASVYYFQGQYTRATSLYERALAIREAALGQNHPDVAQTLNNLAVIYSSQEYYAKAESLYERALAIREASLGQNHPDVADSLHALAALRTSQGNHAQSELLYERALAIREAIHGPNHPAVAALLNDRANLHMEQGHAAQAEKLYERALTISEATLGKNHPNVAAALTNLAALHVEQGRYARAESLHERAIAIQEATLGQNHPNVAQTLISLAAIFRSQGHYERAKALHERALTIREAAFGKNHPLVADSLNTLSNLHGEQGHYEQAEQLLQRALAIREVALGQNHPKFARLLNDFATLYSKQGYYEKAEPLYERALAIWEATLGKSHDHITEAIHNLALLYYYRGDYKRAESLYERALAVRETAIGKNHPLVVRILNDFAQLRLAQHNFAEALSLLERAFSVSEAHLRQESFGLSETRLASVLKQLHAEEERLYALVRAYPDDERVRHLALTAALLRKGRSIEEVTNTSRIIHHSLDEADREDFQRLRGLRTQLSTLSLTAHDRLPSVDYQQRIKELAEQSDILETNLVRRSERMRVLLAQHSSSELIDRVTKALPNDGVLIEFIAYNDSPLVLKPGASPSSTPSELRYLALLLFSNGHTQVLDLGPAAPIDRAALRLQGALASRSIDYQTAAQELHARAFRPLKPLLGKVRRLFIAPDSQLALVPFAALHNGRQFLLDTFDIIYLTSGKDILPRLGDISPVNSVVVLADPDFGSPLAAPRLSPLATSSLAERSTIHERFSSMSRALSDQSWTQLPGTRKEAEAIERLLPQAQLLLGHTATKDVLLKLATPGILHIATHGFFLEDASAQPHTRALGSIGAIVAGPPQNLPYPLLRSGLVLAGARVPGAQPGSRHPEDSLVTALELAGLNLWGTQLVVLSACDTGRGDIKVGQGVYGLRRAMMVAGAETLVTSLWKVNDDTTHDFMEGYYRNLLAGQGRAAALRETMRTLRQKQPHPYFWAPFIAIGRDAPLQGLVQSTAAVPSP